MRTAGVFCFNIEFGMSVLKVTCTLSLFSFFSSTFLNRNKIFLAPKTKLAKFANSIDPDEVAHNEPPHLGLHCLPFSL